MKKYIVFIVVYLLFTGNLFSQWVEVNLPQSYPVFNDVKFLNKQIGLIVGDRGTILRTTNSGLSWNLISSNSTKKINNLFVHSANVYASGDSGLLLRSTNMGLNWNAISFPHNIDLYSVFFRDSLNGFVAGESSILKTTNGGSSWIRSDFPQIYFYSIHFVNSDTGFVSAFRGLSGGNFFSAIYRTSNSGTSWNLQVNEPGEELYQLFFTTNNSVGYAVGERGRVYRTANFGETWTQPNPNIPTSEAFLSTHFKDNLNGWVTAADNKIYNTTNGGVEWKVQLSREFFNLRTYLNSITFTDSVVGYAVGSQIRDLNAFGIIMRTNNGGFTSVENNNPSTPNSYELFQNYPNPFNPITLINYQLPINSHVSISIYDLLGRKVAQLVNEEKSAGQHKIEFNSNGLTSGIYLYKLTANNFTQTRKMMLMK